MRRLATYLTAVAVAVLCTTPLLAEVVVSMHNHTCYSDGAYDVSSVVKRAAATSAQVVIINDHAEAINEETKLVSFRGRIEGYDTPIDALLSAKKHVGVGNWLRDIIAADGQNGKRVMAGLEVGLGFKHKIHVLVYCPSSRLSSLAAWSQICQLASSPEATSSSLPLELYAKLANYVSGEGGLLAAAHPTSGDYPFSLPLNFVGAVEFFNYYNTSDGPNEVFEWLRKQMAQEPRLVAAVGGTDLHFDVPPLAARAVGTARAEGVLDRYCPMLERYTVLQTNITEPTAVIEALRTSHCYAAYGQARVSGVEFGTEIDPKTPLKLAFSGLAANPGYSDRVKVLVAPKDGQAVILETDLNGDLEGAPRLQDCRGRTVFQLNLGQFLKEGELHPGGFLYFLIADQIATSGLSYPPFEKTEERRGGTNPQLRVNASAVGYRGDLMRETAFSSSDPAALELVFFFVDGGRVLPVHEFMVRIGGRPYSSNDPNNDGVCHLYLEDGGGQSLEVIYEGKVAWRGRMPDLGRGLWLPLALSTEEPVVPPDEPLVSTQGDPKDVMLVLLIDRSTSMRGPDDLGFIGQLSLECAEDLSFKSVTVVDFSGFGNIKASPPMQAGLGLSMTIVTSHIKTDDGTAILDAVLSTLKYIRAQYPAEKVALLLITDGEEWKDAVTKDPEVVRRAIVSDPQLTCTAYITSGGRKLKPEIEYLFRSGAIKRIDSD